MNKTLAILLVLATLPARAEDKDKTAADPAAQLAALKFLAGNWVADKFGAKFEAHYSTPENGAVLSLSELKKGDQVLFYEFEVFRVQKGAVWFTPHPKGSRSTSFKLAKLEENKVTFENKRHDWPQRLVYHRKSEKNLVVTLSSPWAKKNKIDVYDFKRK